MGAFWQTALIPGQEPENIKNYVNEIAAEHPEMELEPAECFFHAYPGGACALFHDDVLGFEHLADALSRKTTSAVLLLYIYDDDYWGYFFWENGRELDRFSPYPDYFDEGEEAEAAYAGNPELVAEYFGIRADAIQNYYRCWRAEPDTAASVHLPAADHDTSAYPEDEHCYGDCWQIADFMEKLGCPWDIFDEEPPPASFDTDENNTPPPACSEPPCVHPFIRVSMRPAPAAKPAFLSYKTLENLPTIFETAYIWELLKKYPEELFLLFDYEKYDEAALFLAKMQTAQPENAELHILRAFCCLSHPNPPRIETEADRLAREEMAKRDLDLAFCLAPDHVRLLRMHCLPPERLRHFSFQPDIPVKTKLSFLDRLLLLDPEYTASYQLARIDFLARIGETEPARAQLRELLHMELPEAVDFRLALDAAFGRLEPDKNLKTELERDYKTYIREFLSANPKKKFRQAELCWKRKRAITPGLVRYEKEDLALLHQAPTGESRASSYAADRAPASFAGTNRSS